MAELADAAEALLDRPLAIFGHSMGALLGYEMARELRRRGCPAAQCPRGVGLPGPRLRTETKPVPGRRRVGG
jgi:surfactin synthase thioesterase subunit